MFAQATYIYIYTYTYIYIYTPGSFLFGGPFRARTLGSGRARWLRAGCALDARLMRADQRTPELLGNWKVCWPSGDPGLFTFAEIIGKPSIWSMRC